MISMEPSTSTASSKMYCCNPFEKSSHNSFKKNLRNVSKNLVQTFTFLKQGYKICDTCRKQLVASAKKRRKLETSSDEEFQQLDPLCTPEKDEALNALNRSLIALSESPIQKRRLCEKKYPQEKFKKATAVFKSKVLNMDSDPEQDTIPLSSDCEIINQLKEKFNTTDDKSIRMQILTTLPKSWTLKDIQDEFGVSDYTARKAKSLVKEKGVMSCPDPKPGKTLDLETAEKVTDLYESEEISRMMPGKKDFISHKINGKREHVQKKLVMCNLREAFALFKRRYPLLKIGFSKFCELRPKYCVLAGASGTHSVCVCTTHQNAKLMIMHCRMKELMEGDRPIKSYKDIMMYVVCANPTEACYFGDCKNCPGFEEVKERIQEAFELNCIENITYKQWMQIEKRTSLETLVKPTDEFISILFEKLPKLLQHSFLASQQSRYLTHLKQSLKEGEYLVICDFAENYSFILQDAAQGFHWNNAQATVHPFTIYFQDPTTKTLMHTSLVIISDSLTHDTIAVHLFQKYLIGFMQSHFNTKPSLIYYYSDGAASQYKNRLNFLNLCYHESDFGIKAEWHFFATLHGKSACDGVGGTVKRLAARASLQMTYNDQIMTPRQLYDWANGHIESIHFQYSTIEQHKEEEEALKFRTMTARTIPGTQKLHSFVPLNKNHVQVRVFSFSNNSTLESTTNFEGDLEFTEMVGFLICRYNGHWWLGCVLDSNEENQTVKMKFLHPHGPSPSFRYPDFEDVLNVHRSDVISKVDPRVNPTGRVYILSNQEVDNANQKL